MNLIFILFSILFMNVIKVDCGCEDYVTCVTEFLHTFFFNKNNGEVGLRVNSTNNNVTEARNPKLSELDQVLKRLSSLLHEEIEENTKLETGPTIVKHVEGDTKIFVKSFNLHEEVEEYPIENTETMHFNNKGLGNTDTVRTAPEKINQNKNIKTDKTKTNSFSDIFEKSLHSVKENEILPDDGLDIAYYEDTEDNSTDYPIIDYIDIYKDTTNEENIYVPVTDTPMTANALGEGINKHDKGISNLVEYSSDMIVDFQNETLSNLSEQSNERMDFIGVIPWIVTIFVKNVSKDNQFDYVCDGALMSEKVVLTAARCVNFSNTLLEAEDLLVVLGKNSLQEMGESETVNRITQIIIHENFTQEDGVANNDLAILVMEDAAVLRNSIKSSNITREEGFSEDIIKSATTAWAITGQLEPVFFEKIENGTCNKKIYKEDTLCATYGRMVPLCPSYGGLFVVKLADDQWYLQGIMSGDPSKRGICFKKNVTYTSLRNHLDWIDIMIDSNK